MYIGVGQQMEERVITFQIKEKNKTTCTINYLGTLFCYKPVLTGFLSSSKTVTKTNTKFSFRNA